MKPILFSTSMVQAILSGKKSMTRRVIKPQYAERSTGEKIPLDVFFAGIGLDGLAVFARYQPGDILWVRETWNGIRFGNGVKVPYKTEYWYKADDTSNNPDDKWRPSIHMPREAARIFLRVTGVRAERVQEISEEDAMSEGVQIGRDTPGCGNACINYKTEFSCLWNSLNAKSGYSWESNPWVWAYEFERIEKP